MDYLLNHTTLKHLGWPGRLFAIVLLAGGVAMLIPALVHWFVHLSGPVNGALLGGGMAALATAIGTLPVLFAQQFGKKVYDSMLGLGAGVMLAATAFSLIMPALAALRAAGAGAISSSAVVGGSIAVGAALILVLDKLVSRNSATMLDRHRATASVKRAWLFVGVVALHNIPEGLAIGVAFAGVDSGSARALATAISIQDLPEGLVAALALRAVGYSRCRSAFYGAATGILEPVAAVLGAMMIGISGSLLPAALALAAGAMLFVVVNDVIPESHRAGNGKWSSVALVAGFIIMTILDTALA